MEALEGGNLLLGGLKHNLHWPKNYWNGRPDYSHSVTYSIAKSVKVRVLDLRIHHLLVRQSYLAFSFSPMEIHVVSSRRRSVAFGSTLNFERTSRALVRSWLLSLTHDGECSPRPIERYKLRMCKKLPRHLNYRQPLFLRDARLCGLLPRRASR